MRFVLRSLCKNPGYVTIAVATLTLGIGSATAIFSVVYALLLAPLRYEDPRALVQVQAVHPEQGVSVLAPATYFDVASGTHAFSAIAAQTYDYVNLTRSGPPALVTGVQGTADYFRLFGVAPLLGRSWTPDEILDGASPVVVLSENLWRNQYGGKPEIIGQDIIIDDQPHTVVGIMPASFKDPWGNGALWRPMRLNAKARQDRAARYMSTFARFAAGATPGTANAELASFGARLEKDFPDNYRRWSLQATELQKLVVGDYRRGLLVLLGAVGCVLLLTCATVAGLNLVRAAGRRKELAIRTALGASRVRLVRQLLLESLVLAVTGGLLGTLLGSWGIDLLLATIPPGWLPRAEEVSLNLPVLAAMLAITLATGIISGLLPAFTSSRVDPQDSLKDAQSGDSRAAGRVRSGLVVTELALAVVLLVGAGLFLRNLLQILDRRSGFDTEQVLSLTLLPTDKRYDTEAKRASFYSRVLEEVAAVPGVQSAGFTQTSPFRWGIPFALQPVRRDGVADEAQTASVFYDSVSTDYFKTVGCALLAGRLFDATDVSGSRATVIVSQSTARRFFGEENPIGREIAGGGKTRLEVIGVVGDILRTGLADNVPLQVYRPLAQRPTAFATLMIRTALPPASLAPAARQAIWRVDPDIPANDFASMAQVAGYSVTQPRLYLTLFGAFAGMALLLALLGIYGLLAYSVAQRTREFGIRAALGADPASVLRLVMRQGSRLIALGLLLGLAGALATSHLAKQLLFATSTHDPLVFGTVIVLLAAAALLACLVPARRAARVDPLVALRSL